MIDKTVRSVAEALADIKDGSIVLCAGFAQIGEPHVLLDGLVEQGAKDLTLVGITIGRGRQGCARLIELGRVRKVIVSWARSPTMVGFEPQYLAGKIELELVPQGTLAERIRAAGAGVPAFYSATSVGTILGAGKEQRNFDGRDYVLEKAIFADVALVEAWQADRWGNLTFKQAGRSLNPVMAQAGKLTIAQASHIVELGELTPENVHTPGIFVDRVVHVPYGGDPRTEEARVMEGSEMP
jgi:3-oxoadipate CoA-transferase alpha subunit